MKNHRRYLDWLLLFGLLSFSPTAASPEYSLPFSDPLAPAAMNYHDFAETEALLQALDADSAYVNLEVIGESIDYRTHPASPDSYPIYALRISADSPDKVGDLHDRNAILFECAVHAREWLTTESCLRAGGVPGAEPHEQRHPRPGAAPNTEVWIIPMV